MCGPAKYGEASAKTNYDQPYAHMIIYSIIVSNNLINATSLYSYNINNFKINIYLLLII